MHGGRLLLHAATQFRSQNRDTWWVMHSSHYHAVSGRNAMKHMAACMWDVCILVYITVIQTIVHLCCYNMAKHLYTHVIVRSMAEISLLCSCACRRHIGCVPFIGYVCPLPHRVSAGQVPLIVQSWDLVESPSIHRKNIATRFLFVPWMSRIEGSQVIHVTHVILWEAIYKLQATVMWVGSMI
jgi:hypothetical protein